MSDTNTEVHGLKPLALTLTHNGEPFNVTVSAGLGGAVNVTATGENALKLAATLEAETLERAGAITFSQARQRIRDGQASPVAHLALQQTEAANRLAAALRELHSTCVLMDAEDENQRPTEDEYQAAMAAAVRELGRH